MNKLFSALDHQRFVTWWEKANAGVRLCYPVAAGKITVKGPLFEFNHDGKDAVILPLGPECEGINAGEIWVEDVQEMIAWMPAEPARWYFYAGRQGHTLGNMRLNYAHLYQQPLTMHDTPLAWLKAGCQGIVALDDIAMDDLRGLREVECSKDMGARITARLQRMPKLTTAGG